MVGMQWLSASCDSSLDAAVRDKVAAERKREREWWHDQLDEVLLIASPEQRRLRRAALEAERRRRRESGETLATNDALLRHYLAKVLADNGWDRRYKPVPKGEASLPGRRWGVSPGRTGDGNGRLGCHLPVKLWEQVRRAAYWTSLPHARALQRWQARFGDGPRRTACAETTDSRPGKTKEALRRGPRQADMDRRRYHRAKIVTSGDILRAAANEAIS